MVKIEACCGSVEEALAAGKVGVDRLELCAGLPTGGVTPSPGMIEESLAANVPIVAMVRPREGRPCPPEADFRASISDVKHCFAAGAHEVITGFLDVEGRIDKERNRALVNAAEGRPIAFHRVFDMVPDMDEALEAVIELGFCRILTSGGQDNVERGLLGLKRLVERAGDRITILAGGGVRLNNARRLVDEARCRELHFSFRAQSKEQGYGGVDDFKPLPERIQQIRAAVS
ncbi:MAG: copper homeostasis protein CutC [Armatimonadetes bacterium]|nr:copper homeostasis protein CutC [Armatimonadota bacterium]